MYVVVMGDINIDMHKSTDSGYNSLVSLCETFNLKKILKEETCFTKPNQSSIDVILGS